MNRGLRSRSEDLQPVVEAKLKYLDCVRKLLGI